jgi:hypothetical protein
VGRGAQKGRGPMEVAGDRAVVGASTTGDRGREVGDELTCGVRGTERERGHVCERNGADKPGPRDSERERERGRVGWRRQAGPTCQTPRACERGRARGCA